jgi:flagellar basal-body rod modification protein FlgD
MAVDGVSNTNSSTSSLTASKKGIADNFDTFLSILTTQLKNQNPLDPLDTNAFTQQLVQFSGVEQQLKTNQFLEALLNVNSDANGGKTQAVSYIGKKISVDTSAAELKDGNAEWTYTLPKSAQTVAYEVKDASGTVVHSGQTSAPSGENTITWDGKLQDGTNAPAGAYSIGITATDVAGKPITVTTRMSGIVDGVDFSGSEPFLMVGKARFSLDSVTSVRAA